MESEIILRIEQKDDETIVTVESKDIKSEESEREGLTTITAYSQSDDHGNHSQNHPTFYIRQLQQVKVRTYVKGYNARVFEATLVNRASKIGITIPPQGGSYDLIQGYWNLSVTGQWSSYHNGHWVAGGIFAEVTY